MTWNDERDTLLRERWAAGATYSNIAAELGLTKNSVISRANRLGLGERVGFKSEWTPERDAQLRAWFEEGVSEREIGKRLGISHSAASNRTRRLGLKPPAPQGSGNRHTVKGPRKKAKPGPAKPNGWQKRQPGLPWWQKANPGQPTRASLPPERVEDIPVTQRCSLLDLTLGRCKWPCGHPGSDDFFFCGGRAPRGQVYCSRHARRAYNPK